MNSNKIIFFKAKTNYSSSYKCIRRVFGNLKNVSIVTINNSDIAQAIFNNFEKRDKKSNQIKKSDKQFFDAQIKIILSK